jgi:predicted lipid-binding transport protein (Tim44 family)
MLGGLLLGGLLGSLLFGGGLGHGGVGLLELLLIGGLAYFAFSVLRRRQPALAAAGGGPAASPGDAAPGPAAASAYAGGGGPAVADPDAEDRARGLSAIRVLDPAFDPEAFAAAAREAFVRVQVAWNARDLGAVRAELTDELASALEADVSRLRAERRLNRLEQLRVEAVELTEAWEELGRDFVTVRVAGRGIDYTLDEATGAVVEGSRTEPAGFEEFWTFTRPVGPNAWRLSAIQQPAR